MAIHSEKFVNNNIPLSIHASVYENVNGGLIDRKVTKETEHDNSLMLSQEITVRLKHL